MRIGYACLAVALPGSEQKSCALKHASEERILALIGHNLDALQTIISYNIRNGIQLFRISSDLVPFGSSLAAELPWPEVYTEKLAELGGLIRSCGMRVSMHPGQYTVLNSPDKSVAERAEQDLLYHTQVLDSLGLGPDHKIILHLGGAYGDKAQAKARFLTRFQSLPPSIKNRLTLENDDSLFHIGDVLETASMAGIPAVFDALHNAVNPADKQRTETDWLQDCAATWGKKDGPQKIHYSQQNPLKKPGTHSETIRIAEFHGFIERLGGMDLDIMLEVKDKNRSAVKCLSCMQNRGIGALEAEWGRYKYFILEKSPNTYNSIRQLLKDKAAYPALEMYQKFEEALLLPEDRGHAVNATQHVWGYFKDRATPSEKAHFQRLLNAYTSGEASLQAVKNNLAALAWKHGDDYLLTGYYFLQ